MIKLGDLFEFKNGRSFSKTEWKESGLPIIRIQNLNDNSAGFNYFDGDYDKSIEVNKNDLLFSWSGTVGSSFGPHIWTRDKGVLNQHIYKVSFKTDMISKYAYYALLFLTEEIESSVVGAVGLVHVTKKSLNEFRIYVPAVSEQKRIVTNLDQVFSDIEQARAKTEQNLKNARELFESYLQEVFSQSGDGWIEAKLSDVCEGKITDGTHQTPKYFDEGYIFLSSRNVTSGEIDWNNIKYIDEAQHVAMQKRVSPRMNDILLAKNGTTGVAAIVDRDVAFDIYVSLALLRPSNKILPRYLLHFVNSSVAKNQFNKRLKGVGVPNLHLEEIRDVVISYPTSIKKQQQHVKQIDLLLEQRNVLVGIYTRKLAAIDELKKSILQKAFTGQLTHKKSKGVAA